MNDDIDPRILRACVDTVIEWYAPLNAEELAKNVTEQLRYAKELVQLNPDASDAWAGEVVMHRLVTAVRHSTTASLLTRRDMGDFADALEVHLKQEMSQPPHEEDAKVFDEPFDFTNFHRRLTEAVKSGKLGHGYRTGGWASGGWANPHGEQVDPAGPELVSLIGRTNGWTVVS